MKNKLTIGLIVIAVAAMSFTTGATLVKPDVPKEVILDHFLLESKAQEFINQKISEGWVLKAYTVDKLHWVAMEKY